MDARTSAFCKWDYLKCERMSTEKCANILISTKSSFLMKNDVYIV